MAVDQTDKIDAIGVDRRSACVVLTISDHLPWSVAADGHLELLREKLNAYLAFIESGQLIEGYPDAAGKRVVINVVGKFDLSASASEFLDNAIATFSAAGLTLRFEKFAGVHDDLA
jgi:hypothetical protein